MFSLDPWFMFVAGVLIGALFFDVNPRIPEGLKRWFGRWFDDTDTTSPRPTVGVTKVVTDGRK